jgi:hypothetical protein
MITSILTTHPASWAHGTKHRPHHQVFIVQMRTPVAAVTRCRQHMSKTGANVYLPALDPLTAAASARAAPTSALKLTAIKTARTSE